MRVVIVACLLSVACRPPGYGKGGGDDDVMIDAAGGDDAPTPDAPPAATCDHGFRLDGHGGASSVWLTGSFTMWAGDPQSGAIPFTLGGDGGWTVTHTFAPGQYQYKLIIDGSQWIADPTNPDGVDDGFGGKNSVYTCAP